MADLTFETRPSDSDWVDTVWTCASDGVSAMTSVATPCWGLVFWQHEGTAHLSVTGPETRTGRAPVPEGASFVGIEFAVGTSLQFLSVPQLVDTGVELPDVTHRGFRLYGDRYAIPGADDAEALVDRLVRTGVLIRDPVVEQVRRGGRPGVSVRTTERRFRAATGMTAGSVARIQRARTAARLLAQGDHSAQVVSKLGYFDQPHLARSLRRFVGRTATQLRERSGGALALDLDQRATW